MAILFCNIGWMEYYQGLTSQDQIIGGGSYVKKEGTGHEVCNFAVNNNKVYGYVQPKSKDGQPGEIQINIDRLGANGNDLVTNILVIWTATRPEGGTVVVGWYKNATVHRFYQDFKTIPKLHGDNSIHGYRIEANASDAILLPVVQRTCLIPRRQEGGMGQSNVWFADAPKSQETVNKVRSLVDGKQTSNKLNIGKKTDPDHNAKVEKAAINATRSYFEKIGYTVESVEKDNVGWDLEAASNKTKYRIEVKGLSGSIANAQLTPNEFLAFDQKQNDYYLAIVTQAITNPELMLCRYSQEKGCWVVENNNNYKINIQPKQSAIIQVRI